jgi:DNA topoisomerase-1
LRRRWKKRPTLYQAMAEEKISIENGRWGPFIRFGKKMLKIGAGANGKLTPEELATIELDAIKKMILSQEPKAFTKKRR